MKNKILFFASNPKNASKLRLDQEARDIEEGLKRSKNREDYVFKVSSATRPKDLTRALLDENASIVHFSGHGISEESNGDSGIILENYRQVVSDQDKNWSRRQRSHLVG